MRLARVIDKIRGRPRTGGRRPPRGRIRTMTAATTSTLRVLIADDHRLMLAAVRRALSRAEGVEVVGEVDEATKIVPTVGQLLPDVVLLDIRMPQLDGLTCLERLRQRYPDVAVVILSTFAGDDHVDAARERGASGYIVKTVDPLPAPARRRRGRRRRMSRGSRPRRPGSAGATARGR